MKKINLILCLSMIAAVSMSLFNSCVNDDPEGPVEESAVKQMTLVYAINRSSLSADLVNNQEQMLNAMASLNSDNYKLMIYKYDEGMGPGLYLVKRNGTQKPSLQLMKRYDNAKLSTDPERIRDVINFAKSAYPGVQSNLFLWGHGLGCVNPNKYTGQTVIESTRADETAVMPSELPDVYGFGGEYLSEDTRQTNYIDLDELADAIPNGLFDTIWFDCCYMGGVEVAYQFRNKCNYFIGYPTEIMAEGLPYNLVLPKLMQDKPERIEAAKNLYNYYNVKNQAVTVAVMQMSAIEKLAEATKAILREGMFQPKQSALQNYSRLSIGYYDFRQYVNECAELNGIPAEKINAFNSALDEFVMYSAASSLDFNGRPISTDNFCGISTYYHTYNNTYREQFYKKLDWYKRVWED